MTEIEFSNWVKDIGTLEIVAGEYTMSISNDVETVEFLTGEKTLKEACEALIEIADSYNVEKTISESIKECNLPEPYINIAYFRSQTTEIKDKLMDLKELIIMYLNL